MGLFSFFKKLKENKKKKIADVPPTKLEVLEHPEENVLIPVEELPADFSLDAYTLVEVSDTSILDQLSTYAPAFVERIKHAGDKVSKGMMKLTLPAAASLSSEGKQGYPITVGDVSRVAIKLACGLAGAPGLAISITSQILLGNITRGMAHIEEIGKDLSAMAEAEYKARIQSLIIAVNKCLSFQSEIMQNEELRKRELDKLDLLEVEGSTLLLEVNELILSRTKRGQIKFKKYLEQSKVLAQYLDYQYIIESVLYKIAELRYALNFGKATKAYCLYSLEANLEKTYRTNEVLLDYQQQEANYFGIDFYKGTRKREGLAGALSRAFKTITGKEVDTIELKPATKRFLIKSMKASARKMELDHEEIFAEDVTLIEKEGKVYYATKKKEEK